MVWVKCDWRNNCFLLPFICNDSKHISIISTQKVHVQKRRSATLHTQSSKISVQKISVSSCVKKID